MQTNRARQLYALRNTSVEPFNEWFKSLFELNEQAWHRGLDNNRAQILAAVLVYQLLLRYNRRCRRNNAQVKWISGHPQRVVRATRLALTLAQ